MGPVGNEQSQQLPFDSIETQKYTTARLAHLDYLFPDRAWWKQHRVLEVGAGVGHLTGFFEERGCDFVSTDGRKELCEEHLRRHPGRHNRVIQIDVTVPGLIPRLGDFDVVLCYGLLYHVHVPGQVIEDLASVCKGLLLIETIVHPRDEGDFNYFPESADVDQSLWGLGCRPSRKWLVETMAEHMPFVYQPRTCPKYGEFILGYPSRYETPRAVFVGSRSALDATKFHDVESGLLNEFSRDW